MRSLGISIRSRLVDIGSFWGGWVFLLGWGLWILGYIVLKIWFSLGEIDFWGTVCIMGTLLGFPLGLVPDFGGWSLDTDPNFGQYRHFCSTIMNIRTDRNPNKVGTQLYPRKRPSDVGRFYLKTSFIWRAIGTAKIIKYLFFVKTFSRGFKC